MSKRPHLKTLQPRLRVIESIVEEKLRLAKEKKSEQVQTEGQGSPTQ